MVARETSFEVEGRRTHPQGRKDLPAHRFIVGGAQLTLVVERVGADEPGRRGHRVAVLEEFPELRGGMDGTEPGQSVRRRCIPGPERQRRLPGHAGAGANKVLHKHVCGRLRIAELECRIHVGDRRVPGELAEVHLLRQQQRRQRLSVGRDEEQRVGVDELWLPQLAHAESAGKPHLAVLEQTDGHARHILRYARLVNEIGQELQPAGVELVRRSAGERLADIAGGSQAVRDEFHLCAAPLPGRLASIYQQYTPGGAVAPRGREQCAVRIG